MAKKKLSGKQSPQSKQALENLAGTTYELVMDFKKVRWWQFGKYSSLLKDFHEKAKLLIMEINFMDDVDANWEE